jgi:hypothetical protein
MVPGPKARSPGSERGRRPPECLETFGDHGPFAGPFPGQPHRHPDSLFVHVEPRDPRADDFHRHILLRPPILDTGAPPAHKINIL